MKESHLGRILMESRRGMTQDQLAEVMGVFKAAVSEWETTYPDIFMLPSLAAYFDLSIDEPMGYEPQMDKTEIRKWYDRLAKECITFLFDQALKLCLELADE